MFLLLTYDGIIISGTAKLRDLFTFDPFIKQNIVDLPFWDKTETNLIISSLNTIKQKKEQINQIFNFFQNEIKAKMLISLIPFEEDYLIVSFQNVHKANIEYQSLLEYIINHSKNGVAVFDLGMNYLYVSNRYKEDYNLLNEDIIGKNHYDIFPDLPVRWLSVHKRSLAGEVIFEDRDPHVRMDGSTYWTRWECRPWYDFEGSIGGMILSNEVINTELEIEEKLLEKIRLIEEEDKRVGIILNSIYDALITTDEKGTIIFANAEALKLLRVKRRNIIGKNYLDMIKLKSEANIELNPNPFEMVLKTHERLEIRNIMIEKGKTKNYLENFLSPLKDTDGNFSGVVSLLRDVTEQREKNQEVAYFATHDNLTGLYNYHYILNQLFLHDSASFYPLGLLIIDINGLKAINDTYGFEKGDEIVKAVGASLEKACQHLIGRFAGDEFMILMTNTDYKSFEALKRKIIKEVKKIRLDGSEISLSYGFALRENKVDHISKFISEAESNMYKNKLTSGKSIRNNIIKAILGTLTNKYEHELIHSQRVGYYCKKMGQALGLKQEDINFLEIAGLFHDIGKISIPDSILNKPGKLTPEEYSMMKKHTIVGYQILKAADAYTGLAEYALSHHERWDGFGYPNGLKEEEIPLFSRIINIVDTFEAMTTNRVYKAKVTMLEAAEEINRCSGKQFDPGLAEVFLTKVLKVGQQLKD